MANGYLSVNSLLIEILWTNTLSSILLVYLYNGLIVGVCISDFSKTSLRVAQFSYYLYNMPAIVTGTSKPFSRPNRWLQLLLTTNSI